MTRVLKRLRRAAATLAAAVTVTAAAMASGGCAGPDGAGGPGAGAGPPGALPHAVDPRGAACPDILNTARQEVARAEAVGLPWTGPTSGPRAVPGKSIVYVAASMTNPGVAGTARAVQEAGRAIGWQVRVIDGQGNPVGIRSAFGQAIALRPSGIVIGGFDPNTVAQHVGQAEQAGIPVVGWHAVPAPGPSAKPRLFTNITTRVEDVARISAYWIIAESNGDAGAVIFTDSSIPFAEHKSRLIRQVLLSCGGITLLGYENIPIPDAGSRTPQVVSSLLARFGDRWTHSVAINDLYFADAAPALRAAGRKGDAAPFAIGAGDGDPSAFQRIRDRRYQAATVPEPLNQQGWQIIDEFNRAFAGAPPSGYVAPVHLTTTRNVGTSASWDPQGFREAYRRIWLG